MSLNTDEFINKYKGKSPIHTYEEREEVLLSCKYVHSVIPNRGGQDSKPAILDVRPDYLAIGSDWAGRDYYKQMDFTQEWLDEQDITLVYIPRIRPMSSTLVKERVKS